MSLSKELAAYHEAGHAIRAYHVCQRSLHSVVLKQVVGTSNWMGATGLLPLPPDEDILLSLSLAGLFAEGKWNGIAHGASGGSATLVKDQRSLAAQILSYYEVDPKDASAMQAAQQQMEAIPIWTLHRDGTERPAGAAVSFADLNRIPIHRRNEESLDTSFKELCEFFNSEWWRPADLLAYELSRHDWSTGIFDYSMICRASGLQQ